MEAGACYLRGLAQGGCADLCRRVVDGGLLVLGSRDTTATVVDTATHQTVATLTGLHGWSVCACALSPDGTRLVLGSQDTLATVVKVSTWEPTHKLEGHHTGTISSVAFSPDGRLLAMASYDKVRSQLQAQLRWIAPTDQHSGQHDGCIAPLLSGRHIGRDGRLEWSGAGGGAARPEHQHHRFLAMREADGLWW